MYSNQKEINYISFSNVKGSAEICRPYLHKLLQFSQTPSPLPSLTFYGFPLELPEVLHYTYF